MKKNFTLGKGKYYYNIKSGHSTITIHRSDKQDAISSYMSYYKIGKSVEWLGKWNGRKFLESTPPETKLVSQS